MWNITNCYFETADLRLNPLDDYYISSLTGERLSVNHDKIVALPTFEDVGKFLMETQQNKVVNGWHVKLSDGMWINSPLSGILANNTLTIPLGNLTISFNDADPVPTLMWAGKPNKDFDLLNRYFRRYTNLKAFW